MVMGNGFPLHGDPAHPEWRADAVHLRRAFAGMVVRRASGTPRAGVFPAHLNTLFTGHADDRLIDIAPFVAALTRGASDGVTIVTNNGVIDSPPFDAAPASNARIDVLWLRQNDSVDQADLDDLPEWGITKGTAAGSPTAPAVPSGALAFAHVRIAAGTNFSDQWTITDVYPYTAMVGGLIWFRSPTELNATTGYGDGQLACIIGKSNIFRSEDGVFARMQGTARTFRTTPQDIATNTLTLVTFPTPTINGDYTWSSNGFVVGETGEYRVTGGGRWQTNGTSYRFMELRVNGDSITPPARDAGPGVSGIEAAATVTASIIPLTAGDRVTLVVMHEVAATLELREPFLTIERIS